MRIETGYVIGGVPPLGHSQNIRTLIDSSLLPHQEIWVAAGTPHTVFRTSPHDLLRATGAELVDVKE